MIEVRRTGEGDPLEFEVMVREGKGESRHRVTMAKQTWQRLTAGKHAPERCLEAAFRFLLDREAKEVTRCDVRDFEALGKPNRLRPLPRPRRPQQDEPHAGYFRKPS